MKKYRLIIFDLDGTLVNSLPYHLLAFKRLFEKNKIKIDYSDIKENMGLSTENILRLLKRKYRFKESVKKLHEERRKYYAEVVYHKDIVFPGIKNILRKLKSKYKIAIATGSSRVTLSNSIGPNFLDLFDLVSTIDDVKKGKPHPEQLLSIAKKLKIKSADCLMIGDSFYDGLTAKNAKMDFIGVLTGYTPKKDLLKQNPQTVLKSLNDLPKFL